MVKECFVISENHATAMFSSRVDTVLGLKRKYVCICYCPA